MSRTLFSLAGFQVITIGRLWWVIPEVTLKMLSRSMAALVVFRCRTGGTVGQ
jgi:hypothetical protein